MSRPRKFKSGRRICSMAALSKELDAGSWVFLRGVPKHNSWMISMQYNALRTLVQTGALRYAIKLDGGSNDRLR